MVARRGSFEVRSTLEVADGETLALLGPNGAGKSTVLDVAGRHARARARHRSSSTDGRIDTSRRRQRAIGVCFQDDLLFPRLSALENVAFPLRARKVAKAEASARSTELIERLAPGVDPKATTGVAVGRGAAARRAGARARAGTSVAAARRAVRERRCLGAAGPAGPGPGGRAHVRRGDGADRARSARRADARRPGRADGGRAHHAVGHAGRDPHRSAIGLRRRPRRREPVHRDAGAPRGRGRRRCARPTARSRSRPRSSSALRCRSPSRA